MVVVLSVGYDPIRKFCWHSVYEQVGQRKLGHDSFRYGVSWDYRLYIAKFMKNKEQKDGINNWNTSI